MYADKATRLTADDVSLLYFERNGIGVQIHSLKIDEQGTWWALPPATVGSSWTRSTGSCGFDVCHC